MTTRRRIKIYDAPYIRDVWEVLSSAAEEDTQGRWMAVISFREVAKKTGLYSGRVRRAHRLLEERDIIGPAPRTRGTGRQINAREIKIRLLATPDTENNRDNHARWILSEKRRGR